MNREVKQRWAGTPLLYGSAAIHLAAAAATVARPRLWPWTLGAVVLDHLLIAAAGLWPRSNWLGSNWTRLPASSAARGEIAITIDDGPDPDVTPRVLEVLAAFEARASFFCIGERVTRYPDLAKEIVRRGHSVENHSQRHRHSFSLLGPRRMAAEVAQAQECIARVTGETPRFFRAPAGLRNPFLEPILGRLKLQLVSWTRRGFDTVNADADDIYRRLSRSLADGDILLLHDGHAARTRDGAPAAGTPAAGTPVILEVLPRLLETLQQRQLRPVSLRATLP
jgi:peptidoglycan-N-acetylglucosamine deacetylase